MNYLQQLDLFGHPTILTFSKKGHKHQTSIGGFCSIIIRIFMTIFAGILLRRMITKSDNKNVTFTLNSDESKEIKFRDTNIKYLIILFDLNTMQSIKYDQEIQRYLTVTAG